MGGRSAMAYSSSQSTRTETTAKAAVGKQAAKIAVVNLDAGIMKNDEQIYYANKIIEYPNENYMTTSLEEAKNGIESGQYGAYVIIPSTFSTSVDSINGTPQKAVFEYQISSSLSAEEKEKVIYEVNEFEKSVSTNVAYIYIDAILNEVHNVQDGASTILANDDYEKKSLLNVSAEELIEPIEFSELKENNDTVKPIDLKSESLELQNTVHKMETEYDEWLNQGQKEYAEVVSKNQEMEESLQALEKSVESTNPLLNEQGEYNIIQGINDVNAEIDEYNATIAGKRPLLNASIVNEINLYAQQNQQLIGTWKQEVQKNMKDAVVSDLQTQLNGCIGKIAIENEVFAKQQEQNIENEITAYIVNLQSYLNVTMNSESLKESVKNIVQLQAEESVRNTKDSFIEYGKNFAQREDIKLYNQLLLENNSKIEELQEALKKFDEARNKLEESEESYLEEGGSEENNSGEEEYQEALRAVIEKSEALQTTQLIEEPEEIEEPEISVFIDKEKIDMKPIQEAVDLSKAVDAENNEIKQPEITVFVPTPNISLTSDAIQYQVPDFKLSQADPIKEDTLREIEKYYDIPKNKVADAFEEEVVKVIQDRNSELQKDVIEKISVFSNKERNYQLQLDNFDPFGYVDSSKIENNISNISENIAGIEEEMNSKGIEYLQYTADVFTMANENINILKEDMMRANDKTKKNVTDQISSLKNSRSSANQINVSILESFSKKLSFTRMGDLPYREAYEFIVNPIQYEQSDK